MHFLCSKLDFWKIFVRNYFLLFFTDFNLFMFHDIILKIPEILHIWNLLKTTSSYLPYRFSHNL